MKKSLLMAALAAAVVGGALGCGGKGGADKAASAADTAARQPPSFSTFTDTRDGKVYKTVKIGRQNWFAENLNYAAEGSKCYDNKEKNCAKYGRLYTWDAANKACPAGYHLSSDAEWTTLENAVGDSSTTGKKLKSTAGWKKNGNGTDDYGFSALPGGGGRSKGGFSGTGYCGVWWTATEAITSMTFTAGVGLSATVDDVNNAWYRYMDFDILCVYRKNYNKLNWYSVRCVQDDSDISNKEAQK